MTSFSSDATDDRNVMQIELENETFFLENG